MPRYQFPADSLLKAQQEPAVLEKCCDPRWFKVGDTLWRQDAPNAYSNRGTITGLNGTTVIAVIVSEDTYHIDVTGKGISSRKQYCVTKGEDPTHA